MRGDFFELLYSPIKEMPDWEEVLEEMSVVGKERKVRRVDKEYPGQLPQVDPKRIIKIVVKEPTKEPARVINEPTKEPARVIND